VPQIIRPATPSSIAIKGVIPEPNRNVIGELAGAKMGLTQVEVPTAYRQYRRPPRLSSRRRRDLYSVPYETRPCAEKAPDIHAGERHSDRAVSQCHLNLPHGAGPPDELGNTGNET
jgi:hypothetical protein